VYSDGHKEQTTAMTVLENSVFFEGGVGGYSADNGLGVPSLTEIGEAAASVAYQCLKKA